MADTKYFSLHPQNGCPQYENVECVMGVWIGVAKVENPEEQERLIKLGCTQITEEQYNTYSKKKAQLRQHFPDFQQVPQTIDLAAKPVAQKASEPSLQEKIATSDLAKPVAVPRRGMRK